MLACDEFDKIASEIVGAPFGDGQFFSQAHRFGCMGLLATQSINVLETSSLKEHWRSIFSNLGAKIFMRLWDSETAEVASKLAEKSDWYVTSIIIRGDKELERLVSEPLPPEILTQMLTRGQAVIIGSLDGGLTVNTRFFRVP